MAMVMMMRMVRKILTPGLNVFFFSVLMRSLITEAVFVSTQPN
jgi:hypothetical protein